MSEDHRPASTPSPLVREAREWLATPVRVHHMDHLQACEFVKRLASALEEAEQENGRLGDALEQAWVREGREATDD